MTWGYRILYREDSRAADGYFYELHEVFYDAKGRVMGYTSEPTLIGESKAEIVEELVMMLQDVAGRHPLNGDQIDREEERRRRLVGNRLRDWFERKVTVPYWIWRDRRFGEVAPKPRPNSKG